MLLKKYTSPVLKLGLSKGMTAGVYVPFGDGRRITKNDLPSSGSFTEASDTFLSTDQTLKTRAGGFCGGESGDVGQAVRAFESLEEMTGIHGKLFLLHQGDFSSS